MALNMEGEKIVLRAVEPLDIDVLYQWENNPDLWYLSGTLAPYSRSVLEKYIENAFADIYEVRQLRLMIDLKDKAEAIGAVDLFEFDPDNARAGLGILIAAEKNRQKGYAKEAIQMVVDYCFYTLNLKQLWCNILSENEASMKLFEQCGFKKIGLKKQWTRQGSEWKDEFMLQLINPNRG